MSRYRFRLDSVMRVRRVQEERARAQLALARLAEADAREATVQRRGLLRRTVDAGLPSGDTQRWGAQRDRLDRLAAAVTASHLAELHAVDISQRRLVDWEHAAKELRALERLDERNREVWQAEQLREEQRVLDEIRPRSRP